jgi:hypothetical protein
VAETTPTPHIRVLWRPDQFTRCTNGTFETNTTGWATTAGINAAATSITRITSDAHSGSACASVVTTATDTSGVNFDLGADPYYEEDRYGTTYAAVVWLKRVSGSGQVRLTLGSLGTSTDRRTVLINELPFIWTPYKVVWMPSGTRTDVELAITNGSAAVVTLLVDDVSIYQLDAFNQVEDANFLYDTSGWSVGAGINAAGTSITRTASAGFALGGYYATLVTTSTSGSGADYDFGQRKFTSGRTYRARVAMKSVSGTTSARLRLGSLGTGADRGDASVTITGSWAWYLVDWTASGDRTDVELAVTNGTASAMTALVAGVEVYEAIDEVQGTGTGVRSDVDRIEWTRSSDSSSPGTVNLTMLDPRDARRYTPAYTSGALYGLLKPGRRVWARALYADTYALYPVAFGTIRRFVPDAEAGTCLVMCEDPLYDLARASYGVPFDDIASYREARYDMFGSSAVAAGQEPVAGDARANGTTGGLEAQPFYSGTNDVANALDILEQYNEATGSVHYVEPSALSEYLWRYTTVDRTYLTDAARTDDTISDDFQALTGTDTTDELLENTQNITWQAYERYYPIGYMPSLGTSYLASADDPSAITSTPDDPYLHIVDDEVGVDDGHPEPTLEREWHWKRRRRKRGRRRVYSTHRVYEGAFVPFTMAAGDRIQLIIDWSIPVKGVAVALPSTALITSNVTGTPRQSIVTLYANAAVTVTRFALSGTPYRPLDEQTETRITQDQVLDKGTREGPSVNSPYIGSLAMAQALGDYRNWRYAESRMRPTLTLQHHPVHLLNYGPTDHVSLTAALFSISAKAFVITAVSGSVDMGAKQWSVDWSLEELPPTIGTLFTLDSSVLDGAAVMAY